MKGVGLLLGFVFLLEMGCGSRAPSAQTAFTQQVSSSAAAWQQEQGSGSQPANVGDAKLRATAYYNSGSYQQDLTSVAGRASAWIETRAPQVPKPAMVLDVDDTALSNWEVIQADDFGRIIPGECQSLPAGPCGWQSWDLLARDPPILQTLQTFRVARTHHVAVFFITGRPESQRLATQTNLVHAGYNGYARMYMVPDGEHFASAAEFKAPVRQAIERSGYKIIANMGDQPSDLAGGHAEREFLLPNPFYRIP